MTKSAIFSIFSNKFKDSIKGGGRNLSESRLKKEVPASHTLAASITRAASKQTYYIVRFLVDRDRVADAYRAYAYFRWVDDWLDQGTLEQAERIAFINRQQDLLARCYHQHRADWPNDLRNLTREEQLLVDLIQGDKTVNSGLQIYLRNMMAVMTFDAHRRGKLISQQELAEYSHYLATAVTEALHYFIGHSDASPQTETRYLAATAAHIVHMLRDTLEDAAVGYINIPCEFLTVHQMDPQDVGSPAYRAWVQSRVKLARNYFRAGKDYLAQVQSLRCRLAGYLYIARFETVLDTIEREGYYLRSAYPECKSLKAGLRMGWSTLRTAFSYHRLKPVSHTLGRSEI